MHRLLLVLLLGVSFANSQPHDLDDPATVAALRANPRPLKFIRPNAARRAALKSAKPSRKFDEFVVMFSPRTLDYDAIVKNLAPRATIVGRYPASHMVVVRADENTADADLENLAQDSRVQIVQQNGEGSAASIGTPNDAQYVSSWHVGYLHMVEGWNLVPGLTTYLTSSAAQTWYPSRPKIVVADTGVDCAHEDWVNSGGSSKDAALGGQLDFAYGRAYVTTTKSNPCATWQDDTGSSNGHGSAMTSLAAAATNNTVGAVGAGWMASVVPYKISDNTGSATYVNMAAALTDPSVYINPNVGDSAKLRVVSESFYGTGTGGVGTMSLRARSAYARDILPTVPASNTVADTASSPTSSCGFHLIGLGGVNSSSGHTYGYGVCAMFTMPANSIPVIRTDSTYWNFSGSSDGPPVASALISMMWQKWPATTAAAVLQSLQRSSVWKATPPTGNAWDNTWGYGVMDFQAALTPTYRTNMTKGRIVGLTLWGPSISCCPSIVVDQGTGSELTVNSISGVFYAVVDAGWHTLNVTGGDLAAVRVSVVPGADSYIELFHHGITSYPVFKGKVTKASVAVPYAIVQARCNPSVGCPSTTSSHYNTTEWFAMAPADDQGNYELAVWEGGTYDLRVSTLAGQALYTGRVITAGQTIEGVNVAFASSDRPRVAISTY